MDVGFVFVILLLTVVLEAELKSIELCKFEYRPNCSYRYGCDIYYLYCNNLKVIECDERNTINIIEVNYGTNYYVNSYCPYVCNGALRYSQPYTSSLMYFCNGKPVCDLSQWRTKTFWRLRVNFNCKDRYHRYTSKINTTSVKPQTDATSTRVPTTRQQPSQPTTMSNNGTSTVTESETEDNNAPDQFPVSAVAASVTAGIIVLIIIVIVVVCVKRRRRTTKGNQPDETTLQMQIVTNNSYGYSPPSINREDQQETDRHAYVDITLPNATHAADDTSEQKCVYLNADKVVNKDNNDEYNTLNTYPAPLRVDPNYDHIPKGSHTTVDETYSHITDGQISMPDTIYSHLQDTQSAASRNAKNNKNNSDNVYNHINTKSVEDNVYKNSQTHFNKSLSSHLGETKAVEDDYDHTDWKQTNTCNSKPKYSNNKAVGKLETNNITERTHDEYAVVNKGSDKVKSSDGHNYFVLEKQFF